MKEQDEATAALRNLIDALAGEGDLDLGRPLARLTELSSELPKRLQRVMLEEIDEPCAAVAEMMQEGLGAASPAAAGGGPAEHLAACSSCRSDLELATSVTTKITPAFHQLASQLQPPTVLVLKGSDWFGAVLEKAKRVLLGVVPQGTVENLATWSLQVHLAPVSLSQAAPPLELTTQLPGEPGLIRVRVQPVHVVSVARDVWQVDVQYEQHAERVAPTSLNVDLVDPAGKHLGSRRLTAVRSGRFEIAPPSEPLCLFFTWLGEGGSRQRLDVELPVVDERGTP